MRFATLATLALACGLFAGPSVRTAIADDWPQLQHDAARLGRTTDSVEPPYRTRWIWCGTVRTLRNQADGGGWSDDLTSRDGYSFPIPASVDVTIAESAQVVVAGGRVFIGSQEGKAFGINATDGATLWQTPLQGAVIASAAVSTSSNIVVFNTTDGWVYGLRVADGYPVWSYDSGSTITGAPCVNGTTVYVADHAGYVTALNTTYGNQIWRHLLPKPVQGTPAADDTTVYVGAENMILYALNVGDGNVRHEHQVRGQSFSLLWPVIYNSKVYVTTGMTPGNGSEYVGDAVMADSPDFATEETNWGRWLGGDTNGGRWTDASVDFKHSFALNTNNLTDAFTILCGATEGCGTPPEPPCLDGSNRLLMWWKTRYPTLWSTGAFGTAYSLDISAIDQTNGHRIRINLGAPNAMYSKETDNLYALVTAGNWLWLNQRYRGLHAVNLSTNAYHFVQNQSRRPEGGPASAVEIGFFDQPVTTTTPQSELLGHTMCAPAFSGSYFYIANGFGVACIEHGN